MIELLTFTGVDSRTPFDALRTLHTRWPRVEFGVLVASSSTETADGGILPPLDAVRRFRDECVQSGVNCALHLCGEWSRSLFHQTPPDESGRDILNDALRLCDGFGRVQINLHGDFLSAEWIDVRGRELTDFAQACGCATTIVQHRGEWADVPVVHDGLEYLFDLSGGAGRLSFAAWPAPPLDGRRYGYAGGIGPSTVDRAMEFSAAHSEARLWFDMEHRVRTNGWLDLDKVVAVCERAFAT